MQKNMFEQTSWIIQYVLQIVPWGKKSCKLENLIMLRSSVSECYECLDVENNVQGMSINILNYSLSCYMEESWVGVEDSIVHIPSVKKPTSTYKLWVCIVIKAHPLINASCEFGF